MCQFMNRASEEFGGGRGEELVSDFQGSYACIQSEYFLSMEAFLMAVNFFLF